MIFPPNEPAVQLIAPIIEAQLVETFVLEPDYKEVLASKAARVVAAARGRPVVDFGAARSRHRRGLQGRAHQLSRGAAGMSNLLAARQWDPDVRVHGAQL